MTDPCSEKANINKLFTFHDEKMAKLHDMEMRQVQIQGDVSHIKTRIDNGMSHTIAEMHQWLAELKPKIEHHGDIVKRVEDFGWWVSKSLGIFLLTAVIGVSIWAISSGWKP